MTSRTFAVVLSPLFLAPAVAAQWAQLSPASAPGALSAPGLTFDYRIGRLLLFGGAPALPAAPSNETWAFDGTTWARLQPVAAPGGRAAAALVHDLGRSVTVLYGGANPAPFGGPSLDDTWQFDGQTWSRVTTATTPGGLASMGAAYDLIRQRTVLYGGTPDSFFPIASNQTWEFDGSNWTRVTTANSPGPLERPGMCYDVARQRVVLFGGIDPQIGGTDQTWVYDGSNWTALNVGIQRPPVRTGCQLVYSARRGVCVLHGGMNPVNGAPMGDTWEFDGTAWTQIPVAGPSARQSFALAVDEVHANLVLFGGELNFAPLGDTWRYGGSYQNLGPGCAGSRGVPQLSAAASPYLGGPLLLQLANLDPLSTAAVLLTGFSLTSWNGVPLPANLTSLGLTGCTLYTAGTLVTVTSAAQGQASFVLAVPLSPILVGQRFYNQAIAIDPAANPAGLTLSNAGAGTIGR